MTMGEQQDGAAIVPVCLNVMELLRVVFLASRATIPTSPCWQGKELVVQRFSCCGFA